MSPANIVRILALLLAIAMAFITVPYGALGLALLGLVLGFIGVPDERRMTFMVMALALTLSAGSLDMVPAVGGYLTAIFNNAAAVMQAGVLAIFVMVVKDRLTE